MMFIKFNQLKFFGNASTISDYSYVNNGNGQHSRNARCETQYVRTTRVGAGTNKRFFRTELLPDGDDSVLRTKRNERGKWILK